jgi:hypothetical protein
MLSLVNDVKFANEDFEFYPTTKEILEVLSNDIKTVKDDQYWNKLNTFLDIGAGHGKVLDYVKDQFCDLYAIEKSNILCQQLDDSIYIIGTDFLEQNLIDKNIDVIYCNPPYSEFEVWTNKIIRECNSHVVYLTIPERWANLQSIKESLNYRNAEHKIIDNFDFLNSEDRTARAKVNLIRITFDHSNDAFDTLFEHEFENLNIKFNEHEPNERFNNLVLGKDYIKNIVQIYKTELTKVKKNYDMLQHLDGELLRELKISKENIKELLKQRLINLKNVYWKELISRMSEITDKLITKNRRELLSKLNENGNIDFTESNIYVVILWILKKSNSFIDSQLIEIYEQAISKANCINYKSNEKVFTFDRWRYNDDNKPSHIFLDNRIILTHCGRIQRDWNGRYELSEIACNYIRDFLTIANNLNFKTNTVDERLNNYYKDVWKPGKPQIFNCQYKGKPEILFEIKAHLNGNIHIRFNQKFALALNVEFGRLKGWVKNKEEANNEIDENSGEYFETNLKLLENNILLLK